MITYRINNRMNSATLKVTAILPSALIQSAKTFSRASTVTEVLKTALEEWIAFKKIQQVHELLKNEPLEFQDNFSAETIRSLNTRV